MWKFVGSVGSVPTGCAVRLAVLDKDGFHALAFACYRIEDYWIHAETKARVKEEEKVILLHLEASTFPSLVGTDQKRIITSLTADELRYTNPAAMPGVQVHQVWKRAE